MAKQMGLLVFHNINFCRWDCISVLKIHFRTFSLRLIIGFNTESLSQGILLTKHHIAVNDVQTILWSFLVKIEFSRDKQLTLQLAHVCAEW